MTLNLTPTTTPPAEQLRSSLPELRRLRLLAFGLAEKSPGYESAYWGGASLGCEQMIERIESALYVRDAREGGK